MTDSQWAKRIPIRACSECTDGIIWRHDYNVRIKCPTCKATGLISNGYAKDVATITQEITKKLKSHVDRS